MSPRTRNSNVCPECNESVLYIVANDGGAGVLDVRCQSCWQLKTDSLEDRVRELENRSVEDVDSSNKECVECVQVKEKLENLEKTVSLRHVGAEKKVEKLMVQIERYEKEVEEGAKSVCDLNDFKIRNIWRPTFHVVGTDWKAGGKMGKSKTGE